MDELIFAGVSGAAGAGDGDGFFRIAAATPKIRVADVKGNAKAALDALALPELNLTGYTAGDLFHDRTLLRACERALAWLVAQTRDLPIFFTVGLPWAQGENVYNVVAACCRGRLLGLTVKKHLPNHSEFYERRWFAPAPLNVSFVQVPADIAGGRCVPFGSGIVYRCADDGCSGVVIGIEVCEDLWVPEPPSTSMALAGATVILNPSASDEVIGKAGYRRDLVCGQSARLYCAYAYADAGEGESTTDLVFAGDNIIAENGSLLARSELFSTGMVAADVDLDRLAAERRSSSTWTRPVFATVAVQ